MTAPKLVRQTYHNPSNADMVYSYPTTPGGSPIEQVIPAGGEFLAPKNYERFFLRSGFAVGPAPAPVSNSSISSSDDSYRKKNR